MSNWHHPYLINRSEGHSYGSDSFWERPAFVVFLENRTTPSIRQFISSVLHLLFIDQSMTQMIKIQVLFFASAREAAGNTSSLELELEAGADTGTLRKTLAELFPNLAPMVLEEENLTLALNEEYVISGHIIPLKTGDTVALIPPISGG